MGEVCTTLKKPRAKPPQENDKNKLFLEFRDSKKTIYFSQDSMINTATDKQAQNKLRYHVMTRQEATEKRQSRHGQRSQLYKIESAGAKSVQAEQEIV